MATSSTKLPLRQAFANATDFLHLFAGCFDRWEIAGSIRREAKEVTEVDHVIIPRFTPGIATSLFGEAVIYNQLWKRLEELVMGGTVQQALYRSSNTGSISPRWGNVQRGVMFNGVKHELYTCAEHNWGVILTFRTGPWEFSKMVVEKIRRDGIYRQQGGVLLRVEDDQIVPVKTEEEYFARAGINSVPPKIRAFMV